MTPVLADHDAEPDSNPGLATFWPDAQVDTALTVSVYVVECEPDAAVPVIVIGYVPAGVEVEVVIVRVEEPPEVTLAGENDGDAPDGRPLALSDADCALPDVVAVETVA